LSCCWTNMQPDPVCVPLCRNEFPQRCPLPVQSETFCWFDPVKYSVNNDGAGLQAGGSPVSNSSHLELLNVLRLISLMEM